MAKPNITLSFLDIEIQLLNQRDPDHTETSLITQIIIFTSTTKINNNANNNILLVSLWWY